MWFLWAGGAAVIVGSYLMWRGWRGKRTHTRPVCGQCGFELTGVVERVYEGGTGVCPECGADLLDEGVVQQGARRKRVGFLGVGALLMMLGLGGVGVVLWGVATKFNWNAVKPTWLLINEASAAGKPDDAVLRELMVRRSAGTLSKGQLAELVQLGLARQADTTAAWSQLWGDLLQDARLSGEMTPEQREAYARGVLQATIALRPRVREGPNIPYKLSLAGARGGTNASHKISMTSGEIVLENTEGEVVRAPSPRGGGTSGWNGAGPAAFAGSIYLGKAELKPGTWTASLRMALDVDGQLVEFEHRQVIDVTPRGDATARAVKREGMTFAVECKGIDVGPQQNMGSMQARMASIMLNFQSVPMAGSFGIYGLEHLPDGGTREWKLGSVAVTGPVWIGVNGNVPSEFKAETVTLILRAEPEHAESTVDVVEVWDGEVQIRDVPVKVRP